MSRWKTIGLLCGWLVACGPGVDLDDTTTTEGSSTESSSTGGDTTMASSTMTVDSTGETTNAGETTDCNDGCTGGPPVRCPENPDYTCTQPSECSPLYCEHPNTQFDENGCLRPACIEDFDCPAGQRCHAPTDWGFCASSGFSCADNRVGQCQCNARPDCGGRFCVPQQQVPPVACETLAGSATCTDQGCTGEVSRLIIDAGGGSCLCDAVEPACVYVQPDADIRPGDTLYLSIDQVHVLKLPQRFDPPPFGYVSCEELIAHGTAPPLCECASELPCRF